MSAPRPWRVVGRAGGTKYGEAYIVDAAGKSLLTSDGFFCSPHDAELVVRAVNAHRDLVGALTMMMVALPQHDEGNCHPETEERTGAACCFYREVRRVAEAALLLAEVRP